MILRRGIGPARPGLRQRQLALPRLGSRSVATSAGLLSQNADASARKWQTQPGTVHPSVRVCQRSTGHATIIRQTRPQRNRPMSLKQAILNNVKWTALEAIGQRLFGVAIFIALARLLGPEDLGLVALAGAITGVLSQVGSLGFDVALIQRRKLEPAHLDAAFWAVLCCTIALMASIFAAASWIAARFDLPELAPILQWLSIAIALRGLVVIQDAKFRRELNYRPLAVRSLVSTVVGGLVGITCALCGLGPYSLVAQELVSSAIALILIWSMSSWWPTRRLSMRHLSELSGFAGTMFGVSLLRLYNQKTPALLVGFFLGPSAVAFFSIADRLYNLVMSMGTQTINRISIPMFAKIQDDPERTWRLYLNTVSVVMLVSLPLCAGLAMTVPSLVAVLLGDKWSTGVVPMQIIVLAGMGSSVVYVTGALVTAIGRPDIRLVTGLFRAGLGTFLFLSFHIWGVVGMAIAYLARGIISDPLVPLLLSKVFKPFHWGAFARTLAPPMAATLVMALSVAAWQRLAPAGLASSSSLAVEILIGVAAYSAATLALSRTAISLVRRALTTG